MKTKYQQLHLAESWFQTHGHLYAIRFIPHSWSCPDDFLLSSVHHLELLLESSPSSSSVLLFNINFFPIRGVVNAELIEQVKLDYKPGELWQIIDDSTYPEPISSFCTADDIAELIEVLIENEGRARWIGPVPIWHDTSWMDAHPERMEIYKKM